MNQLERLSRNTNKLNLLSRKMCQLIESNKSLPLKKDVSVVVFFVKALPLGRCVLVRLELKAWMELRGCMDAGMGER